MHLIKITYETITPESAEEGDVADSGWIDEEGVDMEPDEIDLDEGLDVIDKTVEFLRDHNAEPSEMGRGAAPRWWTAYEVDVDYATGEVENHSFHLHGYSDEERAEVYLEVRRRDADEDADYGHRRDR